MSRGSAVVRGLTRHLGWKAASLVIATALWFAIEGAPELVTIQTVPLLYRNLPDHLILSADTPENVRAELRGTSVKLTQAALADISVALDLMDLTVPGERTFTLARSNFTLPSGVSLVRVVPSQVSLRVDRMRMKEIPVKIRTMGALPAGYRLTAQEITPTQLRISGPEARVNQVDAAATDPIDLSLLTQTTQMKVNASIPDTRVQLDSPAAVSVTLTVERNTTH